MSDYKRTSQICTFFQIELILQAAIQQEAAYHGCGQIPADILICLETISQHKQAGIFTRLKNKVTGLPAPGAIQQCAAVITPEWLIWAFTHWDRNDEATALAVRLAEAEISDYSLAHLAPDHGLNILGFVNGATERTLKFLGLGPEADAEQFKQVLQQAVQKARL